MAKKQHKTGTTSFIGEFYLQTGMLCICDPLVNDINTLQLNILLENHLDLIIKNAIPGIWRAFFVNDEHGMPTELIAHNSYRNSSFYLDARRKFISRGTVSFGFGKVVCIIDEVYRNDAEYSLYNLEAEAFYDAEELKGKLLAAPYQDDIKKKLYHYLDTCISTTQQAYGAEIMDIISPQAAYWDGFKTVTSSHWSQDILKRLANTPVATLKGGIACYNSIPFTDVLTYVGCSKYVEAVKFSVKLPDEQFA